MEAPASSQDLFLQSISVPLTWVVFLTLYFGHDERAALCWLPSGM